MKPATIRTKASSLRRFALARRLLPNSAPIKPPRIAAGARTKIKLGSDPILETLPSRPAMELARIKAADTPEACLVAPSPLRAIKETGRFRPMCLSGRPAFR